MMPVTGITDTDPDDFTKFDRINLFDFRRTLPQKPREPKLDNKGKAWGSGKRKNALAVANVKAGSGKIIINGRPLLQYFMMPSQRQRILLPLTVTQYTCLLDVEVNVRGGGTTGQCEACVPAIAKAIQAYDVNARPVLKYLRLLRNDSRRVERKKPGLLKARKGQTYVRR
jgi:small subunit ribosomal protein S9